MHSVERKSSGSAFHRVGPVRENERRPYRTRMYRGTTSNARSADRRARRGTYGVMREAMYVVIRSCKARNTITSILYSMRYFTGSQYSCGNAAVMLRRSPRLIRRTTLAAERGMPSQGRCCCPHSMCPDIATGLLMDFLILHRHFQL